MSARSACSSRTSVELRPGTYTAIGSRDGYRDVRQTFTVRPGRELTADQRGLRRTHLAPGTRVTHGSGSEADGRGSIVTVEDGGRRREFGAAELPVTFGAGADADVVLDGVHGSIQIGRLDDVFFVQPGRGARNLRVGGEPLTGTRELRDGDVIAFDRARLECRVGGAALAIRIERLVTAGDTAPPDLDELARGRPHGGPRDHADRVQAGRRERTPCSRAARVSTGTIGVATAVAVLGDRRLVRVHGEIGRARHRADAGRREPAEHAVQAEARRPVPAARQARIASRPSCRATTRSIRKSKSGRLSDQTIALTLTKLPGLVTLTTEPEVGAQVLLDGMPLGTTPLVDAELTPGVHRLEFSAERHLAEVRELEVARRRRAPGLAATLTPDWAVVSLRTDPPGATVLVDGVDAGVTPADARDRLRGEHDARGPAWPATTRGRTRLLVAANQPQQLPDVKLAQADGRARGREQAERSDRQRRRRVPRPHAAVAAARAGPRASRRR